VAVYLPKSFAVADRDEVLALVRWTSFGHLVVHDGTALSSTPVPFVVDDELGAVRFHLARLNPVWQAAPCDALLIVAGRDGYVSPGWYPSKAEHGKVVPTWNYEVVHLHGRVTVHDDPAWTGRQIRELTDRHEADQAEPWSVDDAPDDYVGQLQRAIVGVEMTVSRIDAKRKASQNRDDDDQRAVVDRLGWP
jgi:transcriptional regulator